MATIVLRYSTPAEYFSIALLDTSNNYQQISSSLGQGFSFNGFALSAGWPYDGGAGDTVDVYDFAAGTVDNRPVAPGTSYVYWAPSFDPAFTFSAGRENSNFLFVSMDDGSTLATVPASSLGNGGYPFISSNLGSAFGDGWANLNAHEGGQAGEYFHCLYNYKTNDEIPLPNLPTGCFALRGVYEGFAIVNAFVEDFQTLLLQLVDLTTGSVSALYTDPDGQINNSEISFFEDSGTVVFHRDGDLTFIDVGTGQVTNTVSVASSTAQVVLTAADAGRLWACTVDYDVNTFFLEEVSSSGVVTRVLEGSDLGASQAGAAAVLSPSLAPPVTPPFWTGFHKTEEVVE